MNSSGNLTPLALQRRLLIAAALVVAGASAQASDYPTTILADHPAAYYRLEELPGASSIADSSPNGINGSITYNSAQNVPELGLPGIDTNSFGFPGAASSDYGSIDIPFNSLLAPVTADGQHGAAFSIECWAQAYSANDGGAYLSMVGMFGAYGSGLYANASGWLLGQTPGPNSTWLFNMKNAGFLNAGAVVPLQWTHLVGTFDGTNEFFYVNGAQVATSGASGYLADAGYDGMIGAVPNAGLTPSGPYGTWNGGIDEIAFYTNALTPAQIAAHYQIGTNSFRVVATAPTILTQPSFETNYAGTEASFSVIAGGTAPLFYQWSRVGSGPIAGATNSTYSFVSQYPADDQAGYFVTVTNAIGTTNSATATLTVLTNLNITAPPYSITRNVGSHAAFRVAAGGAIPIGYQWSVSTDNGSSFTPLAGQTADTLWLTNVQMSQNGYQYSVTVTNPFGSSSAAATLNVQARTETVPLTGYGAIVAADNPVAYYRLDEPSNATVAVDAVGTFDGAYDTNNGPVSWGIPTGIPNDADPAVDFHDAQTASAGLGGTVQIPYALELNPHGAWSVECWIRPDSVDGEFRTPLASMYNPDSGNNVSGWNIYEYGSIPAYWTLVLYNGGSSGGFYTDFGHSFAAPGAWYYLVVTDDGTTVNFYVNGVSGTTVSAASTGYAPQGLNGDPTVAGANEVIGQRTDNAFYGANAGIDDVAFYNYALSAGQVQAHYLNGFDLSVANVAGSVVISWPVGTLLGSTNVAGPYTPVANATSPYTVPTGASQRFFRARLP